MLQTLSDVACTLKYVACTLKYVADIFTYSAVCSSNTTYVKGRFEFLDISLKLLTFLIIGRQSVNLAVINLSMLRYIADTLRYVAYTLRYAAYTLRYVYLIYFMLLI